MLQTVSRLLPELPLILMTAVATHLVMSFAQTLMHYKLGHHPMGGKFFRNHINFHHTYYSKDHLVSRTYLGDEGNNTPFFFIPVFLVGACTYLVLPFDLFVVEVVACASSFYAHVFFYKEYHIQGSRLQRFAWFRRKQELHFVHHRHANSNFAVIHFFWDRILGTYRRPGAGQTQANGTLRINSTARKTWQFMRQNWLSNRIFKSFDDIVDHCCYATNPGRSCPSRDATGQQSVAQSETWY
jgi:sterol desaturase/sphingolipid hydroxylase (fatty acid hydroxylase superfamily)